MTGGSERSIRTQRELLEAGVHLLVATAGRAATLSEMHYLDPAHSKIVVLDEVYELHLQPLLHPLFPSLLFLLSMWSKAAPFLAFLLGRRHGPRFFISR